MQMTPSFLPCCLPSLRGWSGRAQIACVAPVTACFACALLLLSFDRRPLQQRSLRHYGHAPCWAFRCGLCSKPRQTHCLRHKRKGRALYCTAFMLNVVALAKNRTPTPVLVPACIGAPQSSVEEASLFGQSQGLRVCCSSGSSSVRVTALSQTQFSRRFRMALATTPATAQTLLQLKTCFKSTRPLLARLCLSTPTASHQKLISMQLLSAPL